MGSEMCIRDRFNVVMTPCLLSPFAYLLRARTPRTISAVCSGCAAGIVLVLLPCTCYVLADPVILTLQICMIDATAVHCFFCYRQQQQQQQQQQCDFHSQPGGQQQFYSRLFLLLSFTYTTHSVVYLAAQSSALGTIAYKKGQQQRDLRSQSRSSRRSSRFMLSPFCPRHAHCCVSILRCKSCAAGICYIQRRSRNA